jgi:lipid II:glycine glycyltransferase (peptidoglycan interpeptide bridge formation enzyme)
LLNQEKKQQIQKKYQGLPVGLVMGYGHYSADKTRGVITAFAVKEGADTPMAGALFLCHGNSVTYHIGWNGKEGRKCRALNLLLWDMVLKLKKDGFEILDLGGINTEEGADIARYKLSFSSKVIQLAGTYM